MPFCITLETNDQRGDSMTNHERKIRRTQLDATKAAERALSEEMREHKRFIEERKARARKFIEAIEVLSVPTLAFVEDAGEILEFNGPGVDRVGQAEAACRNLELFARMCVVSCLMRYLRQG
jgi:hypothetical protein